MNLSPLIKSLQRGCRSLVSRKIYFVMMIVVPVCFTYFFMNLMHEGLPLKVPVAMVDLDHSSLSRRVQRQLNASELIDISAQATSYAEAMDMVKRGEVYGFFVIPDDFQQKAVGGEGPTLSFYSNMSVFVPGTLSFKGFMTQTVQTAGGMVVTKLVGRGFTPEKAMTMLQPVVLQTNPLHNPWTNYSIYLSNSFIPGMLALLVMLVTCFSVTSEIKRGTSPEWLKTANGSMAVALTGKLLPQTFIFSVIGIGMTAVFYRFCNFPLNNHPMHIIVAMVLLVMASQAFALIITCVLPNMRLALSICSLVGILSFSITGFSFPVEQMYPGIAAFAYVIPLRWYFLIYIDQALNGIPIYYSRYYYVILLGFILLPLLGMRKLKRHCLNPVYVP